jgi:hypothetical protein
MKKKIEVSALGAMAMGLISSLVFVLLSYCFGSSSDPTVGMSLSFAISYSGSLVDQVVRQLNEERTETEERNDD